ncbi:MAG: response regulator [Dehalococcoidales bacterium]|nr:response regulator [Dehalococcoidales bacterium]
MIVDDEAIIRRLLSSMLGQENTIIEAEDGEAAVRLARRHKPDLILMDMMMPKMDGYTACKTLKSAPETNTIPIVMVTATGHVLNMKLSREMGADGYVTKPFSQQDLLDTVDRFLKSPK